MVESVSSRLTAIEQCIQKTEDQLQRGATSLCDAVASPSSTVGSGRSRQVDSEDEDDVTPTTAFLKTSRGIQNAVDKRLQELATLNEQGTFRSQRGGHDQVTVKHKIPWPQNHILAGASKSRVTYDSLSTFQWVSRFCAIIKDESDVNTKNSMLEYLSELMEDAQDFGWTSAKGAHAVLLCKMEEGKVNWAMTDKIDHIRRAHAQKVVNNSSKKSTSELPGIPCKFFQNQKCPHKGDHHTSGQFYRHICSFCNTLGNHFPHALKDCRNSKKFGFKKRIPKTQNSKAMRQNCSHITKGRENFTNTRTISSNTWVNGESGNWRSDYHRFKGHTFAQVLKSTVTDGSLALKKSRSIASNCHSFTINLANSKVENVVSNGPQNCQTKKPCNPRTGDNVSATAKESKTVNVSTVTDKKCKKHVFLGKSQATDTQMLDQVESPRTTGMRCLIWTTVSFCIIPTLPSQVHNLVVTPMT